MISYRRATDSLQQMPGPHILSERQAAGYLGVSLDELRRQVNLGHLRFWGRRAKKKFLAVDLDAWRIAQPSKKPKKPVG